MIGGYAGFKRKTFECVLMSGPRHMVRLDLLSLGISQLQAFGVFGDGNGNDAYQFRNVALGDVQ